MSEIGAIRNAIRAERQLVDVEKAAAKTATNVVRNKAGKEVDLTKGFNIRGPDGTKLPFKPNTPVDKAKTWAKNFYREDFDIVIAKKPKENPEAPKGWSGTEDWSVVRDKKDPGNMIQFSVLDDGNFKVHTSRIGDAYRGQGIGAGMYRNLFEKAKKSGAKVFSDTVMSKESVAVWRRFKELGYPIKEDMSGVTNIQGGQYESTKAIFVYDPLAGDIPNLLKPQAGQTNADRLAPQGKALITPQVGVRPSQQRRSTPGRPYVTPVGAPAPLGAVAPAPPREEE